MRGLFAVFTLLMLAILVVIGGIIFFYNANAVDNNLSVTGPDAGAFGYFQDMQHMVAIWVGGISFPVAMLFIGMACIVIVLMFFVVAKRMRA